ncbi:thioredoxin domain-containing protein [Ralstonia insidiosa]|jgi:thioredoxin 1|uniref:thioredoxin family protein n=1 Tax=Ralstonia TaxID=48736 RepID=UPI000664ADB2|nr:thioredoxin domain-containing protein [Ralstonia insidiosa]KMW48727.1 thioredoxin [Ralstonia sp. MD27]MBX3773561.1 thiol reductase thioredoxin [Ralstonia pickettii]NOZ15754.1 thiol reductase thioredoxin [Betaproteobacteria bacterium]MBA9857401.1 thiol reductase thioredoxin [Ralstonia insidiosa]MBA9870731.1 thiol reductase thioredoxin [Ralstonia insidiosa]
MKIVNDASFQSDVIDASQSKPVVVCFAAEWSHPSQCAVASLEKMESSYAGRATFVTMDFDENEGTAAKYGVSVMPAFVLFANSQPRSEWSGRYADQIQEKLEQLLPH